VKSPVVIKNKPKNILKCIWHFLTHAFQEAPINAHTMHHSEVHVTSPLGLAAMNWVAVLLQGAGAGKDPEIILTASGCSPSPFPLPDAPRHHICCRSRLPRRVHFEGRADDPFPVLHPYLHCNGQLLYPCRTLFNTIIPPRMSGVDLPRKKV